MVNDSSTVLEHAGPGRPQGGGKIRGLASVPSVFGRPLLQTNKQTAAAAAGVASAARSNVNRYKLGRRSRWRRETLSVLYSMELQHMGIARVERN